jgi:hypothetical protein
MPAARFRPTRASGFGPKPALEPRRTARQAGRLLNALGPAPAAAPSFPALTQPHRRRVARVSIASPAISLAAP